MKPLTLMLRNYFSKLMPVLGNKAEDASPAALRRRYAADLLDGIQATQAIVRPGAARHTSQPHYIPFTQGNAVERLHQDLLGKWYDERGIAVRQAARHQQ